MEKAKKYMKLKNILIQYRNFNYQIYRDEKINFCLDHFKNKHNN